MRGCVGLGLAAGLLAFGLPGAAGATDLKVSGVWTAFVVKNKQGQNVCGVTTGWPDGRGFDIEWFEGEDVLTIQIRKKTWEIPPHVRPKVTMEFPGGTPWEGRGLDLDHVTDTVEISVPNEMVKPFSHDIANAASGTLSFTGGSEPPWELTMAGFTVALQAMVRCIDDIAGPAAATTPYAYLHTPQPGVPPPSPRNRSDLGRAGAQ